MIQIKEDDTADFKAINKIADSVDSELDKDDFKETHIHISLLNNN